MPLYVKRLAESFRPQVNFSLAGAESFLGLLGMAKLRRLIGVLPYFLVMKSLGHVGFPLSRYINQLAPSDQRASILGLNSLMLKLGY